MAITGIPPSLRHGEHYPPCRNDGGFIDSLVSRPQFCNDWGDLRIGRDRGGEFKLVRIRREDGHEFEKGVLEKKSGNAGSKKYEKIGRHIGRHHLSTPLLVI